MNEYVKLKDILHTLDLVMSDDKIKHKGKAIRKRLKELPTEDVVEVKHGEWHLLYDCANEGVYCSVCHKKVYKTDYANQKIKSPFCPNCGAKMRKEGAEK